MNARCIAPVASQRADWTILGVDDELGILDIVRRVLNQAIYTVIPSRDGGEAWDIVERNRPSIDLVLTDTVMPGPIEVNYILVDYENSQVGSKPK